MPACKLGGCCLLKKRVPPQKTYVPLYQQPPLRPEQYKRCCLCDRYEVGICCKQNNFLPHRVNNVALVSKAEELPCPDLCKSVLLVNVKSHMFTEVQKQRCTLLMGQHNARSRYLSFICKLRGSYLLSAHSHVHSSIKSLHLVWSEQANILLKKTTHTHKRKNYMAYSLRKVLT